MVSEREANGLQGASSAFVEALEKADEAGQHGSDATVAGPWHSYETGH